MMRARLYQPGFALPSAVFLLVVLSILGAYALNFVSLQQAASMQDVRGSRAYQAARSGLEWSIYQVLLPGTTNLAACPASPDTLSIEGYSVTLTCSQAPEYYEQGTDRTIRVYDLQAIARSGTAGTPDYSERALQVLVSKCRGTDAAQPYQCG